jgi:hypothetical protein
VNSANFRFGMTYKHLFFLLMLLAGLVVLYFGSPNSDDWWLKCPLHTLTGWQCALCGLQRSVHAFLHGEFALAWRYNPALWFLLPYVGVWILGSFSSKVSRSRIYATCTSLRAVVIVMLLMLVWSILRNVIG